MDYIELTMPRPADDEQVDILIAGLADFGFESFAEEENNVLAYVPEKEFDKDKLGAFAAGSGLFKMGDASVKRIADRNWNEVWESDYPSVWITGRCYVRAPFHDPAPEAEFDILISPKMAFGTAHHETTWLMIEKLLETDVKDRRVLDMGCGTGVLAILAFMKKAKYVTAIDNDERAYRSTRENAGLNGAPGMDVRFGDTSALKPEDKFELILANINKNILLHDMAQYAETLMPNGRILLSGFYTNDLDDIKTEAKKCGLVFVESAGKNKWVTAVFVKQ
ncbi:MAG TPA: 50S ribosomal protein L11 methyltransferase [Bacteroidetes bacterium]|nr:50S ribosomal protein L11 methyltransferase [Bacteroidota bacterium]